MNRTPLHNVQSQAGAAFTQVMGYRLADSYDDPVAEYQAVKDGVALIDRSYAGRFEVRGKDTLDLLNRLSTYKVDELPPGTGAGTLLTTNKGRVVDILHLFSGGSDLLMLTSPQTRQRVAEWIDLYTFLEEVSLEDVTEATAMLSLLGPGACEVIGRVSGTDASQLGRWDHCEVEIGGIPVHLLRSDALDAPGYDMVVPKDGAGLLWTALIADPEVVPAGEAALNAVRTERGIPRYGWEISEDVNPWEANLQEFIHFEKGCYIGQEVILRLNTYDKVKRHLMKLELSEGCVWQGMKLQKRGKAAGVVTTAVVHPVTGQPIGLGLLRAALAKEGDVLDVVAGDGERIGTASVRSLPARTFA